MSLPNQPTCDEGRLLPRERAPWVDPARWAFGDEAQYGKDNVISAKVGGRIERHSAISGEAPDRA